MLAQEAEVRGPTAAGTVSQGQGVTNKAVSIGELHVVCHVGWHLQCVGMLTALEGQQVLIDCMIVPDPISS